MTNLLIAFKNIIQNPNNDLASQYHSLNRMNSMGEALELYIKDVFCGTFSETKLLKKEKAYSKFFSYLGNQNNPPDIMITEGDAIEVKKHVGVKVSGLALNSSYPKSKLFSNSPLITKACKDCEKDWVEKDILYSVGFVEKDKLKLLILVYGDCYAANSEVYENVRKKVIEELGKSALEFSETNELGRINRVDPLGITNLRIRGMWTIQNPLRVFSDLFSYKKGMNEFTLIALMKKSKYSSIPKEDRVTLEKDKYFNLKDVKISDPNNPAKQMEAKLIVYTKK